MHSKFEIVLVVGRLPIDFTPIFMQGAIYICVIIKLQSYSVVIAPLRVLVAGCCKAPRKPNETKHCGE
jgi:hypothetical protein